MIKFATGRWFCPGTPVSSTNKTDRHGITEILLKVALNTIALILTLTLFKDILFFRFKIDWMYFDLENSAGCTKDYLNFYDSNIANMGPANLLGSYCGTYVNFTGPTQRYLTLEFHTDASGSGDGFRFRGLRYEPRKFKFSIKIVNPWIC